MKVKIIVAIVLLLASTVVFADSISTSVRFLIPSDVAFALAIRAGNATYTTSGSTDTILFNSTNVDGTQLNATAAGGTGDQQDASNAIFRYRNDGNEAINITAHFDALADPLDCVTVKAGNESSSYEASCSAANGPPTGSTCVSWSDGDVAAKTVIWNIAAAGTADVWLWADFSGCTAGMDNTATLTHTSLATA